MTDYPCHWTHVHGRHEWTPLIGDPEAERVLHLSLDQPVTCPGLTAAEVETREAQAAARIERRPVGTLHVDASAPNVLVRGSNVWVRPLDDGVPVGEPVNVGPGWLDVGYTADDWPKVQSSAGTHDAPGVFDVRADVVDSGLFRALIGSVTSRSQGAAITVYHDVCPIAAPVKRRGLTGKRYRIARRAYAREMRAWRRAGSPMVHRAIYLPRAHVHATMEGGFRGVPASTMFTVLDEAADLSTDR